MSYSTLPGVRQDFGILRRRWPSEVYDGSPVQKRHSTVRTAFVKPLS
jgi:hypothetical protein